MDCGDLVLYTSTNFDSLVTIQFFVEIRTIIVWLGKECFKPSQVHGNIAQQLRMETYCDHPAVTLYS